MDNAVVRAQIMKVIVTKQDLKASDLFRLVKEEHHEISEEDFVRSLVHLASEGIVSLQDMYESGQSFPRFLGKWESNLWLYFILAIVSVAVTSTYLIPGKYPYVVIQWIFGSVFILFAPGYATTNFLHSRLLTTSEVVLLSVGLSLVIVMFFGALLSFSPWGITLISSTLSLSGYTLIMGFVGSWRKYRYATKGDRHP